MREQVRKSRENTPIQEAEQGLQENREIANTSRFVKEVPDRSLEGRHLSEACHRVMCYRRIAPNFPINLTKWKHKIDIANLKTVYAKRRRRLLTSKNVWMVSMLIKTSLHNEGGCGGRFARGFSVTSQGNFAKSPQGTFLDHTLILFSIIFTYFSQWYSLFSWYEYLIQTLFTWMK